jgi:hypothetical protein
VTTPVDRIVDYDWSAKVTAPTVGRIVHYHPGRGEPDAGDVLAAIVTHVWTDSCVNLAVFGRNGTPGARTSVYFRAEGTEAPATQYADWPPRV